MISILKTFTASLAISLGLLGNIGIADKGTQSGRTLNVGGDNQTAYVFEKSNYIPDYIVADGDRKWSEDFQSVPALGWTAPPP